MSDGHSRPAILLSQPLLGPTASGAGSGSTGSHYGRLPFLHKAWRPTGPPGPLAHHAESHLRGSPLFPPAPAWPSGSGAGSDHNGGRPVRPPSQNWARWPRGRRAPSLLTGSRPHGSPPSFPLPGPTASEGPPSPWYHTMGAAAGRLPSPHSLNSHMTTCGIVPQAAMQQHGGMAAWPAASLGPPRLDRRPAGPGPSTYRADRPSPASTWGVIMGRHDQGGGMATTTPPSTPPSFGPPIGERLLGSSH